MPAFKTFAEFSDPERSEPSASPESGIISRSSSSVDRDRYLSLEEREAGLARVAEMRAQIAELQSGRGNARVRPGGDA